MNTLLMSEPSETETETDVPFHWLRLIRCARGAGSVCLNINIGSPSLILQSGLLLRIMDELKGITRLEDRTLVQSNTSFEPYVN